MITQHAVGCTEDTQCTADFSTDPLTMEYAHKPYTMLSPISACVISSKTLTIFDDQSNISMRQIE